MADVVSPCVLLAIDPGQRTGWAISRPDKSYAFGTWELKGVGGARSIALRDNLDSTLSREGYGRVAYEEPFQSQFRNAVRSLYHLEGEILSWCEWHRIPVCAYTPREIKASIAGGNATKDRMINVIRWLGYPVEDDHQADAMAQLLMLQKGIKPMEKERKSAAAAHRKKVAPLFAMRWK